jgi:hypothetical protein
MTRKKFNRRIAFELGNPFFEWVFEWGVIAKGSNQVRDPEQKRRENAEGRKTGEAVS